MLQSERVWLLPKGNREISLVKCLCLWEITSNPISCDFCIDEVSKT